MNALEKVRPLWSNQVLRQSAIYTGSAVLASVLGAVITIIVAKALTTDGLGVYSFSNAAFGFLAMFFEFGLLVPAARRLPTVDRSEQRSILGAATALLLGLAVAFSVTLFLTSFVIDNLFAVKAGDALRLSATVSLGWALTQGCLMLAQGTERLGLYSAANLGSKVFYLGVLGIALITGVTLTPKTALFIESATLSGVFLVMLVLLKPLFGDGRRHYRMFVQEAKTYGFAIYFGRVLTSGTYNMDVLLLAWLATSSEVAFYALAASMAAIVSIPPTGVASAIFGQLARWQEIPRRWLVLLAAVSVGGAIAASLLAIPFVEILLGRRFQPVIGLLSILAMAQAANGFNRILNNFLWAHARGNDLRTSAIVLTITNLVLNLALIPPFGAVGAAWASLGAMTVNVLTHYVGYRRTVEKLSPTSDGAATAAYLEGVE